MDDFDFGSALAEILSEKQVQLGSRLVPNGEVVDYNKQRVVRVYTESNVYRIVWTHSYLGCTASSRKYRVSEDWTRGNDLPDGPPTRETWQNIKNAILRYEFLEIPERETISVQPPLTVDQ